MKVGEPFREVGVTVVAQFGEKRLGVKIGFDDYLPEFADDFFQEIEVALFRGQNAFPVPLIDIGAMIVVEEIILAHSAHVGAQAFSDAHAEFLQRNPLPFRGGLHDLGIDRVLVVVVCDVELDGSAGAVAVQQVIHTAFPIDDKRHRHHHKVKVFAEIVFNEALEGKDGLLGLSAREETAIFLRKDLLKLLVIANAGTSQVRYFASGHSEYLR